MYKIISHRGNLDGPNVQAENTPNQINKVLNKNYDVEVDIFLIKQKYYLGHDIPKYFIDLKWLIDRKEKLWLHCKNIEALQSFLHTGLNFFWHQEDDFTLTSKKYIWTYPGKQLTKKSICVLPENGYNGDLSKCAGICSDYILNYLH